MFTGGMADATLRMVTRSSARVSRATADRDAAIVAALDEGHSMRAVAEAADLTENTIAKVRNNA